MRRFSIYLVDHAWTFRPESAREQLNYHQGLLERMLDLLDVEYDGDEKGIKSSDRENLVEIVMEKKWKIAQTYSIGNPEASVEEKMPVWYILDEFAARIQHDDNPNFRLVPFMSLLDGGAYSLLFPIGYVLTILWCNLFGARFRQNQRRRSRFQSS